MTRFIEKSEQMVTEPPVFNGPPFDPDLRNESQKLAQLGLEIYTEWYKNNR